MRTAQECYKLYWTSPGSNTPWNNSCIGTYLSKTIQIRWTRHARYCWRSKDELISDIFQWTFSHGRACVGWPTRTYQQQLCAWSRCSLEDLPRVMDDSDEWRERERVREINAMMMMMMMIKYYSRTSENTRFLVCWLGTRVLKARVRIRIYLLFIAYKKRLYLSFLFNSVCVCVCVCEVNRSNNYWLILVLY